MQTLDAPHNTDLINAAERSFSANIESTVARLSLSCGTVIFCDVMLLTERDLVVVVPPTVAIPDRGEMARCSLFMEHFDEVARMNGVVHWEMAIHGKRLAAIFLEAPVPQKFLDRTDEDRRGEIRFPANLASRIQSGDNACDGRLVNYSLTGLAVQSEEPAEIGSESTIQVDADGDIVELECRCAWNIDTAYGVVNGYSITKGEGIALACRAFRGSVKPWDLNATRGSAPEADAVMPKEEKKSGERELLSRTSILLLSMCLLGMAISGRGTLGTLCFLGSCVGVLTFIGLDWIAQLRQRKASDESGAIKRAVAEKRLQAHVAAQR